MCTLDRWLFFILGQFVLQRASNDIHTNTIRSHRLQHTHQHSSPSTVAPVQPLQLCHIRPVQRCYDTSRLHLHSPAFSAKESNWNTKTKHTTAGPTFPRKNWSNAHYSTSFPSLSSSEWTLAFGHDGKGSFSQSNVVPLCGCSAAGQNLKRVTCLVA